MLYLCFGILNALYKHLAHTAMTLAFGHLRTFKFTRPWRGVVRKAIGGENGRAVDTAIPDALHSSATILGLERLRHTMRILHVVAVFTNQD